MQLSRLEATKTLSERRSCSVFCSEAHLEYVASPEIRNEPFSQVISSSIKRQMHFSGSMNITRSLHASGSGDSLSTTASPVSMFLPGVGQENSAEEENIKVRSAACEEAAA
jgi:hypothetical protein